MTNPTAKLPPLADRFRYRIRFAKRDDLRFIGHRDLLRTLERLFRRADLQLRMTEGFHPKPRLSFPLALAVGIVGEREVMELELTGELPEPELLRRLQAQSPPGLDIETVELLPPGGGKAPVCQVTYEMDIPGPRREAMAMAIETLLSETTHPIYRSSRKAPIDLRPLLESLTLTDGRLRFVLRMPHEAGVRPREVLEALGAADIEQQGFPLTRSDVQLKQSSYESKH